MQKLLDGKLSFSDYTNKILEKFKLAAAKINSNMPDSPPAPSRTAKLAFSFALLNGQISYFSDIIDHVSTVSVSIEAAYLSSTPHLTSDIVDFNEVDDFIASKNSILNSLGQKVGCLPSEIFLPG